MYGRRVFPTSTALVRGPTRATLNMYRRSRPIYRRRPYVPRPLVPTSAGLQYTGVLTVTRSLDVPAFHYASSDVVASYDFALDDLPSYTDFTVLFDQYKINWVEMNMVSNANWKVMNNSSAEHLSDTRLFIAKDFDGAPPTTMATLLQIDNIQLIDIAEDGVHKVSVKPKHNLLTAASGTSSQTGWIDCATPSVPHYGIVLGGYGLTNTGSHYPVIRITARVNVSFKSAR